MLITEEYCYSNSDGPAGFEPDLLDTEADTPSAQSLNERLSGFKSNHEEISHSETSDPKHPKYTGIATHGRRIVREIEDNLSPRRFACTHKGCETTYGRISELS